MDPAACAPRPHSLAVCALQTPDLLPGDGSGEVPADARPGRQGNGEDAERWPRLRDTRPLRVVQGSGEAIFVPSGWHHQVHNLSPLVLSINHNWFGAACCGRVRHVQHLRPARPAR